MENGGRYGCYIRGVTKRTTDEEIKKLFEPFGEIIHFNRIPGQAWVDFRTEAETEQAIEKLHHVALHGGVLSVRRIEPQQKGKVERVRQAVNTVNLDDYAQSKSQVRPVSKNVKTANGDGNFCKQVVEYTNRGISVDGCEYPIPQALYLVRLSRFCSEMFSSSSSTNPYPTQQEDRMKLLHMLTRKRDHQAKEVSEALASAEAVDKLRIRYRFSHARVFVLGDGKEPLGAAAVSLHFPDWKICSIDPLANQGQIGNISVFCGMSEDFTIPDNEDGCVTVVVACHSHAPLQEFYDRVSGPRCCVTVPCCAQFNHLRETALSSYDDFEIYSTTRRVNLYADGFP